jgi:chemosensory pili system protein ChpA (sensor histidine kinase/response regulator)
LTNGLFFANIKIRAWKKRVKLENKKTIVIIDDDTQSVKLIKAYLEAKGFIVTHIDDAQVALQAVHDNVPDLILLDIIMPKMDGFTLAKKIRYDEKLKNVPIVVSSAQEGMKELFAIEGINDYLVKPIDRDALLEIINKRIG